MPIISRYEIDEGSTVKGIQTNRAFLKGVAIKNRNGYPEEYIVTVPAVSEGDNTVSLTSDAPVFIESGTVLTFPDGNIVVSIGALVDAATPVKIFPAINSIGGGNVCIFGMIRLSCSEITNWNQEVVIVSTKRFGSGEQDSDERVGVIWGMTCKLILYPNDIGYYNHILPSVDNHAGFVGRMFLFCGMPADSDNLYEYAFGPALVHISEDDVPVNEVRRPVLTAKWQHPYMKSNIFPLESCPRKKLIIIARKLAGVYNPPDQVECPEYRLATNKASAAPGDTFTITFTTNQSDFPYAYTITGVTSADIGGASLTGTFSASGETRTYTAVNPGNFTMSLDNGEASVGVVIVLLEHIESFSYNSGQPVPINVQWDFTFTTTNPNVPNDAQIYLVSGGFDTYGQIGTYISPYIAPNTSNSFNYTGPEISIGTGRSVSGWIVEEDGADFDPNSGASASAVLKFVWN